MIIYRPLQILLAGILKGTRSAINFIAGANVTLTVEDNQSDDRVDVTIIASGGAGSGDMTKAVYDVDADNIVDKAEILDDGAGNTATAADTKDAVTKKHTQGTDQGLDTGGANAVVVADVKDAVTKKHSQGSDTALGAVGTKNPPIDADKLFYRDSVTSDALVTSTWTQIKAFLKTYWDGLYEVLGAVATHSGLTTGVHGVGAGTIAKVGDIATDANLSVAAQDAVTKRHTQGTDTTLGTMSANIAMDTHKLTGLSVPVDNGDSIRRTTKITEANLEDAVDKKHTQNADTDLDATFEATFEKVANKGAVSGYAELDAAQLVVKNPANATATPTASKIPIADGSGKLDGWITDKPKFLADKNGTSQTGIPLDTGTKITFTNEVFDVGGGYDAANSKWIPGVIGNYRINCNLYLDTAAGAGKYVAIGLFKNGVNIQQSYDVDGIYMVSISRSVAVTNVADYFEIYIYQNAINNNSINGGTHLTSFSGYMLP